MTLRPVIRRLILARLAPILIFKFLALIWSSIGFRTLLILFSVGLKFILMVTFLWLTKPSCGLTVFRRIRTRLMMRRGRFAARDCKFREPLPKPCLNHGPTIGPISAPRSGWARAPILRVHFKWYFAVNLNFLF